MRTFLVMMIVLLSASLAAAEGPTVRDLTCEHRTEPLGIDLLQPRLSWIVVSPVRGTRQSAYRILVASDDATLTRNTGDLWDTGRVTSDASVLVRYQGQALTARQRCSWKVMVWDQDGTASQWATAAHFEIGLPTAADWQDAKWMRLDGDPRTSPLAERLVQLQRMKNPNRAGPFPLP